MRKSIALLLALSSAAPAAPCFQQSDYAGVTPAGWRLLMPAPCPMDNFTINYNFYPQTACVTQNTTSAQTSSWNQGALVHRIWADRWSGGAPNHAPNPPGYPLVIVDDGVHGAHACFLAFSTLAKAIASTQSKVAYTVGKATHNNGKGYLDFTEAAGIADDHVIGFTTFQATGAQICGTFDAATQLYTTVDYVVLPQTRIADLAGAVVPIGVELDYEPQDGRSADDTNAVVDAAIASTHGKGYQVSFYTNRITSGSLAPANGITSANLNHIFYQTDAFSLMIWAGNPQHQSVADMLNEAMGLFSTSNYAKFNLIVDMGMSTSDAQTLRQMITTTYPFGGLEFWNDPPTQFGGACTTDANLVLQTIMGLQK